jgi:hypothetical protein
MGNEQQSEKDLLQCFSTVKLTKKDNEKVKLVLGKNVCDGL